jgi:hypothetical protein
VKGATQREKDRRNPEQGRRRIDGQVRNLRIVWEITLTGSRTRRRPERNEGESRFRIVAAGVWVDEQLGGGGKLLRFPNPAPEPLPSGTSHLDGLI